jgi:hypothetical protein
MMRASSRPPVTKSGYGIASPGAAAWTSTMIRRRRSGGELAERKLLDLFDVADETALANGRRKIFWHDLPITKGLRGFLGEVEPLAAEVERRPVLVFLAEAGVPDPLDDPSRTGSLS